MIKNKGRSEQNRQQISVARISQLPSVRQKIEKKNTE